jgi:hypothetical protein
MYIAQSDNSYQCVLDFAVSKVFIGHKLYSEINLYYFKFHWNKHYSKHHISFLEKEKKSKTKLYSYYMT